MDGVAGAEDPSAPSSSVGSNERVASKLKAYFELAKEEVDKAVRAEEWVLPDDAFHYYQNAQRILAEAKTTPVPSTISFLERSKVKFYREKICTWHDTVLERLQVLKNRGAGTSASTVRESSDLQS